MLTRLFLLVALFLTAAAPAVSLAADQWTPIIRRLSGIPVPPLDSDYVTHTPAVLADWDGAADCGDVDECLDQLAERVADVEVAGGVGYTPADGSDWIDPDPATVASGLDKVADRVAGLAGALANLRRTTVTVGAEAADVITLQITLTDGTGAATTVADQVWLELYADTLYTTLSSQMGYGMADGGDGSVDVDDNNITRILCTTTAAGSLQVSVTDTLGASGTTLYGRVILVDSSPGVIAGVETHFSLTFDGV